MRQARALHLPNEAFYMEEIKFWLQDLQEHAIFIRRGLLSDSADFSDAAQEFQRAFSVVLQKTEKLKSVKQMKNIIGETTEIVREFQNFQRKILSDLLCGRLKGAIFPLFIDHMIREAQYFLEFLQKLADEKEFKTLSYTRELVTWLRFLADHTKLLDHDIDPSERRMRKLAGEFSESFERLGWEARDWASMLYGNREPVRAFERFVMDVRVDVQRLRDFFKIAEELIADNRLLSLMTIELIAHMRREADHCLLILTCLEKGVFKNDSIIFQDDTVWSDNERVEDDQADSEAEDILPQADVSDTDYTYRESTEPEVLIENNITFADDSSSVAISTEQQNDAPLWIVPAEELRNQVPLPQAPIQPDTVYKKAGEQHLRPSNASGVAPAERYNKVKRQSALPRPLGKAKQ